MTQDRADIKQTCSMLGSMPSSKTSGLESLKKFAMDLGVNSPFLISESMSTNSAQRKEDQNGKIKIKR